MLGQGGLEAESTSDQQISDSITEMAARLNDANLDERRKAASDLYDLCYAFGERAKNAIPPLLKCLEDSDEKIRESARWGLGYSAPHSIEPLVGFLAHDQLEVRLCAIDALAHIGEPASSAVPLIRAQLQDQISKIRSRSAFALGQMKDASRETITALAEMCESADPTDRGSALHALGNIGRALTDKSLLDAVKSKIFQGMQDASEDVRWSAVYAAESLEMPHANRVEIATRCLADTAEQVREIGLQWLRTLAGAGTILSAIGQLRAIIDKRTRESAIACEVLSKIGPDAEAGLPSLIACLNGGDDQIQLRAAEAVWNISHRVDEILPVLDGLMEHNGEAVCDIICGIGVLAAPLIPSLIKALQTEDWDLQWAAADALGAVASSDSRVVNVLIESMAHDSPIVRSAARGALIKTGAGAVAPLAKVLKVGDEPLKKWAADTLGFMGIVAADALPALQYSFRTGNGAVRSWSAVALGKISGEPAVVDHLLELVDGDEQTYLRAQAVMALANIRPPIPNLVERFKKLLDDNEDEVVEAAHEAIARLSSPTLFS